MTNYEVTIKESSKELSARERLRYKDVSNAISLDKATDNGEFIVEPVDYAILEVHNERSDNKDYEKLVIEDASGELYTTGSSSFISAFVNIHSEMCGESYQLACFKRDSKNYSGKQFLTCRIL